MMILINVKENLKNLPSIHDKKKKKNSQEVNNRNHLNLMKIISKILQLIPYLIVNRALSFVWNKVRMPALITLLT